MSILDVDNKYTNLATSNSGILSNFSLASSYGRPKTPFVNNNKRCINFDKAKEIVDTSLKSVDSLYVSLLKNTVYFVGFKNSTFSNVHNNLVEKAYDSTIVHHRICNLSSYNDHQNIIVGVLSLDKEKAKTATDKMLFSMLNNSGYSSYTNVLSTRFKNSYNDYLNKNGLSPSFVYDDFHLIFDADFDSFANSI